MSSVKRSFLRGLEISKVISVATSKINSGDNDRWARVRRMWGGLVHGSTNRRDCENELAWAMGYPMIQEDCKDIHYET